MSRRRRRSAAEPWEGYSPEEMPEDGMPMEESPDASVSSSDTVSYRFPEYNDPDENGDPDATQQYVSAPETGYDEEPPVEEDADNVWAQEDEALPLPDDDEYLDDADHQKRSIFKPRTKKPPFVVSVGVGVVRAMLVVVLLAGLAVLGSVAGIAKGYVDTAPSLNLAALDDQQQTSFIYDNSGKLITEYKGTENRIMVSIAAMPKYLQDAFVAVEDARFYTHSGIDLKRIVGAFVSNLSSSSTQGGSTITQQLIKNTLLSSEQSYKRKIQEAYLALQLEQQYTKQQILESYLNTIYLGENYYGVKTAAQGYFGKELSELTLRECAILAGATNSPYYYNPRRNFYTRHKEGVDYPAITNNRTNYVLRCMYENQFITYEQYQAALDPATAHVLETDPTASSGMYPYAHYIEYAIEEIIDIFLELESKENTPANRAAMEQKFRTGGYSVQLCIDTQIQETLQSTISSWTKYPSLRDPSDKVFRSKNSDGTYDEIVEPQAAAVVLDYRSGEILAIVGGRNEPKAMKTLNRATDMKMPVGSSIKPISVYAPALEIGASPASVVYNMPLPIPGWKDAKGNDTWPRNYGGSSYTGPITLRKALQQSSNTAAAQTLMSIVGVSRSVDFLHQLGIDDNHIDATPFGVTLGSSGITPMQMTVAYGVLANSGIYLEPMSVRGISKDGVTVWDGAENQTRRRVFSASTSYMIVDMLKSAVNSGTGSSAKIKGQTVAGKTGTNSDQKGVFFAGMTGHYASALWIGHDNYKALSSKSTGSGSAAPLWQAYMSKIHSVKGLDDKDILSGSPSDYGLVRVTTCNVSGQLATDACRNDANGYGVTTDYWAAGAQPTVYCQMHHSANICAETGMLASAYCPNVTVKGVVDILPGHPLYQFLGTQYEDTLEQYLGASSVSSSMVCTLHTEFSQTAPEPAEDTSGFAADAYVLLTQAQDMLNLLDPASTQYQNVSSAIALLNAVLSTGGSQSDIISAMSMLTQAMAGF